MAYSPFWQSYYSIVKLSPYILNMSYLHLKISRKFQHSVEKYLVFKWRQGARAQFHFQTPFDDGTGREVFGTSLWLRYLLERIAVRVFSVSCINKCPTSTRKQNVYSTRYSQAVTNPGSGQASTNAHLQWPDKTDPYRGQTWRMMLISKYSYILHALLYCNSILYYFI